MKKIFLYAVVLVSSFFFITSCEKDEIGGTATEEMAGQWYVQYDHHLYGPDPFGVGSTALYTYNTASDNGGEIWLTDDDNFWEYKVRIPVNQETVTFGSGQIIDNIATTLPIDTIPVASGEDYLITPDTIKTVDGEADSLLILYRYLQARVENGKIIPDAVELSSGVMADSIYFELWFEDLAESTEITNDTLFVSGYRKTGFVEDEP